MKYRILSGLPGMLSQTTLIPDLELGIVVLTNTDSGGGALFSAVSNSIVDSYLGLEDQGWIKKIARTNDYLKTQGDTYTEEVWKTVETNDNSIINPENYTGTYKDDWFGEVKISEKDGQLWFTSKRSPKLNGPMKLYKDHTFAIAWATPNLDADAFATFNLNKAGKGESIKMRGISPHIDFSYDFQDLDLRRVE
ncbi:DUF3471 domain-containing protein [Antarcticibacterium sp. 1MA-6-2]|uniref:DUF3471 domain-containing protein n=1 Tax=Antarcticibacterium sp. 1MA-6-2 TaxID=2908210 RepID=UPI001F388FB7|nr:DUF3471 domain-containing protein [Antarcticibacterium sp. 1MA-6-2]UJH92149.1 DUF3471 domain-containing protein [Antarcticibacterium sp. 1MA-6-2]